MTLQERQHDLEYRVQLALTELEELKKQLNAAKPFIKQAENVESLIGQVERTKKAVEGIL